MSSPAKNHSILARRMNGPVPALPVDLFRILSGIVVLGYLLRVFWELPRFHLANSLLDHELGRELFWFTWQPLFSESHPAMFTQAVFAIAIGLTICICLGAKPRLCALGTYLIVVCSYRYNFLIISVDDVIAQLLLFWLCILPSGRTLTLSEWRLPKADRRQRWLSATVPGASIRLLLANIVILYLVSGLSKWGSPMWREGTALYAIMSLRPGWFSDLMHPSQLAWLVPMNYAALVFEPFVALLPILKTGSRIKGMIGAGFVVLHLFIIATLDVPFANLGCLAFFPLLFRNEISILLGRRLQVTPPTRMAAEAVPPRWRPSDLLASVVVFLIAGAMLCSMTQGNWRQPEDAAGRTRAEMTEGTALKFFFGGLWMVGLVQQYRLLDWIDERNFLVAIEATEVLPDGRVQKIPESSIIPQSMRGSLAFSYLVGATWIQVPADRRAELRRSLHQRLAAQYAAQTSSPRIVRLNVTIARIYPGRISHPVRHALATFRCEDGRVIGHEMNLDL